VIKLSSLVGFTVNVIYLCIS